MNIITWEVQISHFLLYYIELLVKQSQVETTQYCVQRSVLLSVLCIRSLLQKTSAGRQTHLGELWFVHDYNQSYTTDNTLLGEHLLGYSPLPRQHLRMLPISLLYSDVA